MNRTSRQKGSITSAHSKTPEDWRALIIQNISEPYLQGWAASIIAWDLAGEDGVAGVFDTLGGLIEQYGRENSYGYETPKLQEALILIGYGQAEAEERCALTTKTREGRDSQLLGARPVVSRTWSLNRAKRKIFA